MPILRSIIPVLFFAHILSAGPLWQAMELFEQGRFAESAPIFEPFCSKSPMAYYYCRHLAEAPEQYLKMPPVDAITSLDNPDNKIAYEAFSASLNYYQATTGSDKKAALARLSDIALNSRIGTAFFLLAKLSKTEKIPTSLQKIINLKKSEINKNTNIKSLISDTDALLLLSLDRFEFRSIYSLSKNLNELVVFGRKISSFITIFNNQPADFTSFEKMHSQLRQTHKGKAIPPLYKDGQLAEIGAHLGSVKLQVSRALGLQQTSMKKALYWYSWAAEQGASIAFDALSHHYHVGTEIPANYPLAFKYAKLGESISINAKVNLGVLYEYAHGTDQDLPRALQIYLDGYAEGQTICAFFAGNAYLKLGDLANAKKWYQLSWDLYEEIRSANLLASLLVNSDDKEERNRGVNLSISITNIKDEESFSNLLLFLIPHYDQFSADQLVKTVILLESYLRLHPDDGRVLYALGLIHSLDHFPGKNIPKAIDLLKRSAERNQNIAFVTLGEIYQDNLSEPLKAIDYYQKAYDAGFTMVAFGLGYLLMTYGHDDTSAVRLFKEVLSNSTNKHLRGLAAYNLAQMHRYNLGGLTASGEEIIRLYGIAFEENNDAEAAYIMGYIYAFGEYKLSINLQQAEYYLEKSHKLGHKYSKMVSLMVKFISQGKIKKYLVEKHAQEIMTKLLIENVDQNDILNFMMRLKDDLNSSLQSADIKTTERSAIAKIKDQIDVLNQKKEVDIKTFNKLTRKVLKLSSPAATAKCTKKGFIYKNEQDIFSLHRPHKLGTKISGDALRKGLEFLKSAADQKDQRDQKYEN